MATKIFFIGLLFILLASCGEKNSSKNNSEATAFPQAEEDNSLFEGQYVAVLQPLNAQVTGKINGAATISREKNELVGDVRVALGAPGILHNQYVHEGTNCPSVDHDTNGDGYIDIEESNAVVGKILIPMDGDLGSQASLSSVWPVGDTYGNYIYSRVTSYERFINDLRGEDEDIEDNYVKIAPDENLNLVGRVIIIHGVALDAPLPETVGSRAPYTSQQTLPIACGIFTRVETTPGNSDDDIPDQPVGGPPSGENRDPGWGNGEYRPPPPPTEDTETDPPEGPVTAP